MDFREDQCADVNDANVGEFMSRPSCAARPSNAQHARDFFVATRRRRKSCAMLPIIQMTVDGAEERALNGRPPLITREFGLVRRQGPSFALKPQVRCGKIRDPLPLPLQERRLSMKETVERQQWGMGRDFHRPCSKPLRLLGQPQFEMKTRPSPVSRRPSTQDKSGTNTPSRQAEALVEIRGHDPQHSEGMGRPWRHARTLNPPVKCSI